jgi:hypothetical protein
VMTTLGGGPVCGDLPDTVRPWDKVRCVGYLGERERRGVSGQAPNREVRKGTEGV